MRTADRTTDGTLSKSVAAIGLAVGAVGVSFGAVGVAAGLPAWLLPVMSTLIFAGGSQFMAVGLMAAGNPFAAVLAGLLLNARHLPFGLALADTLGDGGWPTRLIGSHLLVDETVAFALAQPDPHRRRRAYWLTGVTLFIVWNVGTLLGVALGAVVSDPAALGLDAAFPAGLLALLLPSLRDRATRRVALLGATIAVLTTPLLPAGLPVLLALAGLAALWLPVPKRLGLPAPTRLPASAPEQVEAPERMSPSGRVESSC
jgi:4-azaleucine resistance transporter AzlC